MKGEMGNFKFQHEILILQKALEDAFKSDDDRLEEIKAELIVRFDIARLPSPVH